MNDALAHGNGLESLIMLNSAYAEDDPALWPRMITLFTIQTRQAPVMAIAKIPSCSAGY
ncbi:hypothetical protein [Rhodopila sp.]|uniref:hypothetical protein n=1 Tax=Rhodopila sp. TaxID=2480087 RepID=UPI003D0ACA4B